MNELISDQTIVKINSGRDLAMTNKSDIGKLFVYIKTTKNGLLYLQSLDNKNHFISVSKKNADIVNFKD